MRYRLADAKALKHVLGALPAAPGRWHFRFAILAAFVELTDRMRGRDAVVQGIEARKAFERMRPTIAAAGLTAQSPPAIAETYWAELQRWLAEHVVTDDSDADRAIADMLEGLWLAPHQVPQRPERFSSAVLPRATVNAVDERELLCLDLVQVPTVEPAIDWLWAVLSTAAIPTYAHTSGLIDREPWRFVTWAFGEPRTYQAELADPVAHEQLARLYGETAKARARADYPALQLLLRRVP